LTGQAATFYRSDLAQLPETTVQLAISLDDDRPLESDLGDRQTETTSILSQQIKVVDQAMAQLRFYALGDMVCSKFNDIMIRGYGRADSHTHAFLLAGTLGQFVYEFIRRLKMAHP
jgi:wobble nucleotide-excising tRNase